MRRLPARTRATGTRIRDLERKVGALERALENERAWRARIASVLAHEINNPLQYLLGNIELALMDMEGKPEFVDTARGLGDALRGAERIGDVTRATTRGR